MEVEVEAEVEVVVVVVVEVVQGNVNEAAEDLDLQQSLPEAEPFSCSVGSATNVGGRVEDRYHLVDWPWISVQR